MGRWFKSVASALSVLSLIVGLASTPIVDGEIRDYLRSADLPERGAAYYVLWAGVLAVLAALVITAALLSSWRLSCAEQRRRSRAIAEKEQRAQQQRKQQQETLQKVLDTADNIRRMLSTIFRELSMESTYDDIAMLRLKESVAKNDMVILKVVGAAMAKGTHRAAPEVGTILQSITTHSDREIASALVSSKAKGPSVPEAREMIKRAKWGVGCVRLLVRQLENTIVAHPVYTG